MVQQARSKHLNPLLKKLLRNIAGPDLVPYNIDDVAADKQVYLDSIDEALAGRYEAPEVKKS